MGGDAAQSMVLAQEIIGLADLQGARLAVAESLTGGMVAAALVAVPGASRVFSGAVVAYDTALKHALLGVDRELLAARGPVDPEVAKQMARGVRHACAVARADVDVPGQFAQDADIGVATTGVAGPDPDPQTGQAPGTVWIGVSTADGEVAIELRLHGNRQQIREGAVRAALQALQAALRSRS